MWWESFCGFGSLNSQHSALTCSGHSRHEFDDFLGGVGHRAAGDEGEAGGIEGGFAGDDVVAFEADDEGERETDFLDGFDDAGGDDVAIHDATENVDEDGLHVRIAQDDLERRGNLILRSPTTHVQEVGRHAAEVLDDVHGGHGQTGTIDHAGNVAIQPDIIQH